MAVTLADLRLGAQQLADKVNDPSVDATTWNAWINQGVEVLYRRVTSADPDAFYASADFTLTGGVSGNTYALPATFRTLMGVTRDPTSTTRYSVPKFNFQDRNDLSVYPYPIWPNAAYRILGTTLYIEPFEYAAGSYRVQYRQSPTALTSDGSALDTVLEPFAEYVMCFAARKGLAREESETTEVAVRMRELEQEIIDSRRDLTNDTLPDLGWG